MRASNSYVTVPSYFAVSIAISLDAYVPSNVTDLNPSSPISRTVWISIPPGVVVVLVLVDVEVEVVVVVVVVELLVEVVVVVDVEVVVATPA
jgi:hypothetical protein